MDDRAGRASELPYLPIVLSREDRRIEASGLLDTGATINVLPHQLGIELGAVWEELTSQIHLTGNLSQIVARPLMLTATVASFPPARLAFAWAESDAMPLILGQVNFFMAFDVCFFRSQSRFEVKPSHSPNR
jgi:hypothetical protein